MGTREHLFYGTTQPAVLDFTSLRGQAYSSTTGLLMNQLVSPSQLIVIIRRSQILQRRRLEN